MTLLSEKSNWLSERDLFGNPYALPSAVTAYSSPLQLDRHFLHGVPTIGRNKSSGTISDEQKTSHGTTENQFAGHRFQRCVCSDGP
jgi:hypothetical protein